MHRQDLGYTILEITEERKPGKTGKNNHADDIVFYQGKASINKPQKQKLWHVFCLEDSKEKILAKLAEIHPDYNISDADFQNRIYSFNEDDNGIILTHKFDYTYSFTKVNGKQSKSRTSNININPVYCGFCGKKFKEDTP